MQTTRWRTPIGRLHAQARGWWHDQSAAARRWLVRGVVGLAALTAIAGALLLIRDTSREFESLPEAYESLGSVGVDCKTPVRTDVTTGRERTLCSASDGSLAILQLSDSVRDAQAAVGDAHADSEEVTHYAQIAKQTPVEPRPVLLGNNWTLVAKTTVLERVASEYGGTIYPYPETPNGS